MPSRRVWTGLAAFVFLAAWSAAIVFLIRRFTAMSPVAVVLGAGVWFQLALALLSEIEDLNALPDLVSAHPLIYLSEWFFLVGLFLYSIGSELTPSPGERGRGSLDTLIAVPLLLALMLGVAVVAFTIVPLNYFLYLLTGSPARVFLLSDRVSYLEGLGGRRELREAVAGEPLPPRARVVVLRRKPVTLTFAMSAVALKVGEIAAG